jgi:hypothetical protein
MTAKVTATQSVESMVDEFMPKTEAPQNAIALPSTGEKVGAAQLFENGVPFPPDFDGVVKVSAVKRRGTQNSGVMIFIECSIESIVSPGVESSYQNKKGVEIKVPPCELGQKRSYGIPLSNLQMSGPNRKQFTVAALGIDWTTRKAYYEQANMQQLIDSVVAMSEINDVGQGYNVFESRLVHLRTSATKTQKGGDFTVHTWTPARSEVDPAKYVSADRKFDLDGFKRALVA